MPDSKHKILIVDDDNFLLNMYSLKFKKDGYEIFTAIDGTSALAKIEEGLVPDVILLDIIMPSMDGLKFLEEVRAKNLVPDTAIVILTNESQTSDIERAKKLNIDGYIVKATSIPSEVVSEVAKVLKTHKH